VQRRQWRTTVAPLALPAAALLAAAAADRLDVPVVGHLVQRYNVYRLAGLVLPLAAFVLVWLAAEVWERGAAAAGRLAIAVPVLWVLWLTVPDAAFHDSVRSPLTSVALLLAVTAAVAWPTAAALGRGAARPAVLGVVLLAAGLANGGWQPVHLGYDHSDPGVAAALKIGRVLPPGAVVAADPAIYWLRAVSQRAVVAECKGIAFGGAAWAEDDRRIEALGGWKGCLPGPRTFDTLTLDDLEQLGPRYGVTDVLLSGHDPKLADAKARWPLTLQVPPSRYPLLDYGWWLFHLPTPPAEGARPFLS